MKRFLLSVLLALATALPSYAQATRIQSSGTLPTNCTVGNIYIKTGTAAGFYACLATDTWTRMVAGPTSSTDEALVRFDGTTGNVAQNGAVTASDTGVLTFPDGVRQTFNPDGTAAGVNVGSQAGDPGTPSNGDLWYDSTANELTARINGANVALGSGGSNAFGTVSVSGQSDVVADSGSDTLTLAAGSNITLTTDAGTDTVTIAASGSGGDVTMIEEQTPSGTGTITFSSLGSFTHLEIRYVARSTKAAVSEEILDMRFNADTGANYDTLILYGPTTTAAANYQNLAGTTAQIGILPAATATADRAGAGVIRINDYRGTTFNKIATCDLGYYYATAALAGNARIASANWRNTGAITSITLLLAAGNYVAGSKFTLYGYN